MLPGAARGGGRRRRGRRRRRLRSRGRWGRRRSRPRGRPSGSSRSSGDRRPGRWAAGEQAAVVAPLLRGEQPSEQPAGPVGRERRLRPGSGGADGWRADREEHAGEVARGGHPLGGAGRRRTGRPRGREGWCWLSSRYSPGEVLWRAPRRRSPSRAVRGPPSRRGGGWSPGCSTRRRSTSFRSRAEITQGRQAGGRAFRRAGRASRSKQRGRGPRSSRPGPCRRGDPGSTRRDIDRPAGFM